MHNASLPNIFLASKSFNLADFSLSCIVPYKSMQFFLYPISHPHPLTRAYVHTRVITANYIFCCHKCHTSRHSWWKILPNLDYKRAQRKTRRGGERKVENTPLPKSKNREEIRTKKRKAVKGFLVVCVVRNRLLRQQVNKVGTSAHDFPELGRRRWKK